MWIVGGTVDIVKTLQVGEMNRHVGLAENDRSGVLQTLTGDGILPGNIVLQLRVAPGRRQTLNIVGLFDGHRHAVKRAPVLTGCQRSVRLLRTGSGLVELHTDHGINRRIVFLHPLNIVLQQFHRTDIPVLDAGRQCGGIRKCKFVHDLPFHLSDTICQPLGCAKLMTETL